MFCTYPACKSETFTVLPQHDLTPRVKMTAMYYGGAYVVLAAAQYKM